MKRLSVTIFGRVQGVGFRYFLRSQARALGLNGWVQNTDQNTVESMVEGSETALKEFLKLCHKGPLFARVENVIPEWETATKEFSGFEILR